MSSAAGELGLDPQPKLFPTLDKEAPPLIYTLFS